jgi:hypothetical protein
LTTTNALAEIFRDLGFSNVETIPCPVATTLLLPTEKKQTAPHLLYAGAARRDKGFSKVVDLITLLAEEKQWQPLISVQISASHSGKYDKETQKALQRLAVIDYPHICRVQTSLSQQQYAQQFERAITLLLYDPHAYQDKFSGICLDSLMRGAPVITSAGLWLGDTITRFHAGVSLVNMSIENIYQAVKEVYQNYESYHQNALHAGAVLVEEHHPKHTVEWLKKYAT